MSNKTFGFLLFVFYHLPYLADAQVCKNNVWCFGDSAKLKFDIGNLFTDSSGICSLRSSATVSDSSGNLLFYANTSDYHLWITGMLNTTTIRTKSDTIMMNGDSISAGEWYHDIVIIPKPNYNNNFYVFTAGVSNTFGLFYHIVDLNYNQGFGMVTQKNVRLTNQPMVDNLMPIRHANGRDWWLLYQDWDPSAFAPNNNFYCYLITPSGITQQPVQSIGPMHTTNAGSLSWDSMGSSFVMTDWRGLIAKYDFNRCSGTISNPVLIEPEITSGNYPYYMSSVISPSGQELYVTSYQPIQTLPSYLYQFDLFNTNIASTKFTLDSFYYPEAINQIKMGPDDKIYLATFYDWPYGYPVPFPDSVHNPITDNLSVINQPDSPGVACDFQKYSVYLGGRRTYGSLPNNVNYALGPLAGSLCDTLSTGIAQVQEPQAALYVTYESNWKKIFVNAQRLKGRQCRLSMYDVNGRLIDGDKQESYQGYYTKSMEMGGVASGVYVLKLETEKEVLTTKIVIP